MARLPEVGDPYKWVTELPAGPLSSVGSLDNALVESNGTTANTGRLNEDRYYTCNFQDKVQLYMVLDGHDGVRACDFVQKHLPSVFLRCDLDTGGEAVNKALETAVMDTEREFFNQIDPYIQRRHELQRVISTAKNSYLAHKQFPSEVKENQTIEGQINGGTTVAVAAIYNQKLYVANVGDTRVLLCSMAPDGQLTVNQLSVDHNTSNDDELQRLAKCGLDPAKLKRSKRVGTHQNSRSIGDYSIKGGYKDIDLISHATMEPGTAEPFICDPVDLSNVQGFLVLMSDGLYEAYEVVTKCPTTKINEHVAQLIADEMKETTDFSNVAQNVVDKVKSLLCTTCQSEKKKRRLDDVMLIVKKLEFPVTPSKAKPTPAPRSGSRRTKQQKPDETKPTDAELKEMYDMYGSVPPSTDKQQPDHEKPPEDDFVNSFFNSDDLQTLVPSQSKNEAKQDKKPLARTDSTEEVVLFSLIGPEPDDPDGGPGDSFLSYIKNWTMLPEELSWDDIPVDL